MLFAVGCAQEIQIQTPLERLLQTSRSDLCSGILSETLSEMGQRNYRWTEGELQSTLRWAIAHNRDECGGSVSGMALWLVTIEAWQRMDGEAAGSALVGSLRFSFRQDPDPERGNDTFTEQTEAALQALQSTAPHSTTINEELLEWYSRNAENCAIEPYQDEVLAIVTASEEAGAFAVTNFFPPTQDAGQCAPGWMLSDVVERVQTRHRERILDLATNVDNFGEDIEWLLYVVDRTTGQLQDALAAEACTLSVTLAERAFLDPDADPRDAVADTYGACAAPEGGTRHIRELQRRLVRWLIDNDREDEAWTTVETMPEEDIDDLLYYDVGLAAIYARLDRSTALSAFEIFEIVGARDGLDHPSLQPVRDPLHLALIEATREHIAERNVADAKASLDPAERTFGESDDTRRLRVLITLVEGIDSAESGTCLEAEEMSRLRNELLNLRGVIRDSFREDSELRDLMTTASRVWRPYENRCRRRRR